MYHRHLTFSKDHKRAISVLKCISHLLEYMLMFSAIALTIIYPHLGHSGIHRISTSTFVIPVGKQMARVHTDSNYSTILWETLNVH